MYPYIKVNPKVVAFLGLTGQRYTLKQDGNTYLWKFDLIPLGGNNEETIRMVGGVGLSRSQVAMEQRGEAYYDLPVAEDERFRMETTTPEQEHEEQTQQQQEVVVEPQQESEQTQEEQEEQVEEEENNEEEEKTN